MPLIPLLSSPWQPYLQMPSPFLPEAKTFPPKWIILHLSIANITFVHISSPSNFGSKMWFLCTGMHMLPQEKVLSEEGKSLLLLVMKGSFIHKSKIINTERFICSYPKAEGPDLLWNLEFFKLENSSTGLGAYIKWHPELGLRRHPITEHSRISLAKEMNILTK